jgi:CheY-like chemotaxis protein
VELHGGSVDARSDGLGNGSEFILRLAALSAAAVAPPEPAGPIPPIHRRILVVDDNRDAATSLFLLLKIMGHDVDTAHDGPEAVERASTFRADVILMDIGMPHLNGYEAARRIRAQRPKGVTLIALSGWAAEEDRQRSRQAGFDAHLVKPVNPDALTKLLVESGAG